MPEAAEAASAESNESQQPQPEAQQEGTAAAEGGQTGSLLGKSTGEPTPSGDAVEEPQSAPDPLAKFKNDIGETDLERLSESYIELSSKLGAKKEALLEEARAEEAARLGNVPKTADEYQIPSNLAEGYEVEIDPADPLLGWFKDYAHKNNMPQAHFEDAVKAYMGVHINNLPDLDAVVRDLGEGATDRIAATDNWLAANLDPQHYGAIAQHANSKLFIEAVETLVNKIREPNFSGEQGQNMPTKLTLEELRSMQDDPKYWRDKDPAFLKRVEDGYKRLFAQ